MNSKSHLKIKIIYKYLGLLYLIASSKAFYI